MVVVGIEAFAGAEFQATPGRQDVLLLASHVDFLTPAVVSESPLFAIESRHSR